MRLYVCCVASVGVLLAQLARCEPILDESSTDVDKRQYLPPPFPPPSNYTNGDQPCSPNEDLYTCVDKIAAGYSFDTTDRGTPNTLKVPVKMYNERGYASGSVEVDFQLKAENCKLNAPEVTYKKQFNFCNSQGRLHPPLTRRNLLRTCKLPANSVSPSHSMRRRR